MCSVERAVEPRGRDETPRLHPGSHLERGRHAAGPAGGHRRPGRGRGRGDGRRGLRLDRRHARPAQRTRGSDSPGGTGAGQPRPYAERGDRGGRGGMAGCGGALVALLARVAPPATPHWLTALIRPFQADDRVAGSFARQIPRPEASPLTRYYAREYLASLEAPRLAAVASR